MVRSRSGTITRTGWHDDRLGARAVAAPVALSLSLSLSAQAGDARPAQSAGTRTTRAMRMVGSSAPKETHCPPDGCLKGVTLNSSSG